MPKKIKLKLEELIVKSFKTFELNGGKETTNTTINSWNVEGSCLNKAVSAGGCRTFNPCPTLPMPCDRSNP